MTFPILLRKELLHQWRTRRILTMALMGLVLALLATLSELGLGLLLELIKRTTPSQAEMGPLLALLDRDPTLLGAAQNYFKNFFILSLVLVVLGMGAVAGEARDGELAVVLVRPVSRIQIILSKMVALILSGWLGLLVSLLVFVLIAGPTLGSPRWGPFLAMTASLALFLTVYGALIVASSAWAPNSGVAIGLAGIVILLSNLSGVLPLWSSFFPEGSYQLSLALAYGKEMAVAPLCVVLAHAGWLALLVGLGSWGLSRREV
jgi:ABC-type transport system involved in multi-copper enzyme maturation permease subunit